jgi:hypothetical protein
MMQFRKNKDAIVTILGNAENGRYQTVGFQRQTKSADEVLGNDRMVQVYYSAGDFPKKSGRINGPNQHDMTFNIDLTVSRAAEGDLSILQNPASTSGEIAAALLLFSEASELADQSIDELINIVYQVIMDAQNIDFGLTTGSPPVATRGVVSNRWIDQIQKNDPVPRGEYVILTASMKLTCRGVELIDGDSGIPGEKVLDTQIDIEGDDVEKAGVTVEQ